VARILILSIYHDPEPIPKTGELARSLQRRGHAVTVVTAFPHYPSGELYRGYRLGLWKWENREGVRILRTFIYPYHGRRTLLRMLNYLSWMISSVQAAWLAPACDVMYVWHPPLTIGVSAWLIGKLKRVPFVYDVQDLWPESALASGLMRPGRLVNALHRLADWVYARAPAIFVVSDAAAAYLRQRGVNRKKVSVAPHWIDVAPFERVIDRDVRTEFGWRDRFIVMFAGNLGMVQGLDTIIAAATELRSRTDVKFVLVGDGSDRARLEAMVAAENLSNVSFLGHHSQEEMPAFLRAADALLVHLRPSEIADHAVPTKILAYLAAGRPIVCATGGAAGELVRQANAGVTAEPGNAADVVAAITRLQLRTAEERTALGSNGRAFVKTHFEKEAVIDRYERALTDLAGMRAPRTIKMEERV
jgi:colanic acid biosynthesis glycosyl transferase WcaI